MKFDYCIGNPPYQDGKMQVYPVFFDSAKKIGNCVDMIFPVGWQAPKKANGLKILNNKETKEDCQIMLIDNVDDVFPAHVTGAKHTNIIVWKRDYDNGLDGKQLIYTNGQSPVEKQLIWNKADLSAIVPYPILLDIKDKVCVSGFVSIDSIIESQTKFDLDALYSEHPELKSIIGSGGRDKRVRNDAFSKLFIFTETPVDDDDVKVFGLLDRQRTYRFVHRRYLDMSPISFSQYRVILPEAAGVGFGCKLSKSIVIEPFVGLTQTYISFGGFDDKQAADNCSRYISTKFLRVLLSILKITRRNNKDVWKYVPLQDFTSNSDIDWAASIPDIDHQLYKKYGLTQEEIDFIETHVKEMK